MHTSPLVLGVDARTVRNYSLASSLEAVGDNTGNIVFSEAVYNCVRGGVRSSYDFGEADLEGRDAIVIAAANWVNDYMEVPTFLRSLEKTALPICVMGLGAQSQDDKLIPRMLPDQERLIRLFADRGHSIAVRGEYTAEVLSSYGIKNVEVTGCPSLLLMGDRAALGERTGVPEKITVHGTRYQFSVGYPEQEKIFSAAYREGYHLVLQSELADMYYGTQRFDDQTKVAQAEQALDALYPGEPIHAVRDYLRDHAKVFFDLDQWISYAKSRDFIVGSRIHGTVVSLLAGTRSLLLTHDSRTRELAKAMNIPHASVHDFGDGSRADIRDLYDRADHASFSDGYAAYRERFAQFLRKNSLALSSIEIAESA